MGPSLWALDWTYPLVLDGVSSGYTMKGNTPFSLNLSVANNCSVVRVWLSYSLLTPCPSVDGLCFCADPMQSAVNLGLQRTCLDKKMHFTTLIPIFQLLFSFQFLFHSILWALQCRGYDINAWFRAKQSSAITFQYLVQT